MNIWWILVIAGALTFGMRFSFIFLLGNVKLPDVVRRALRFVPPAVLTALVLPELLMPAGYLDLSLANHRWLAGLIAGLVAWRTNSAPLTFLAGAVALLILQTML
jgi:branched-subunit amino acid transport protein